MLFIFHGGDAIEAVIFWLIVVPLLLTTAAIYLIYRGLKWLGTADTKEKSVESFADGQNKDESSEAAAARPN